MRQSRHGKVAPTPQRRVAIATPPPEADVHGAGSRAVRSWRAVMALAASLAVTAGGAVPAVANGPGNSGGPGNGGSANCTDVLGEYTTTSLTEIRQQIGAGAVPGLTGAGVGVAVIDTGINQVPGLAGSGKVVDGPDLSFDALNANLRHRDLHGHGTNMAAIIAAQGATGGDGVAPDAQLVNVKVGTGDGTVDVSQVIAAIDWVVQNRARHNVRVLNLAFDTDAGQSYVLDPLSHAVENAWKAGIVVVVAGGNDGRGIRRLGNPAINPFVIAVGAANDSGFKVTTWSSTGDGVRNPDLVAPGMNVLSATVPGSYLADTYPQATCVDGGGTRYLRGSGTSQAAAVVSGAAALLLQQRPSLTPDQVKYLLTSTAVYLGRNSTQTGNGRIDLAAALATPTPGAVAVQTHAPSTGLGTWTARGAASTWAPRVTTSPASGPRSAGTGRRVCGGPRRTPGRRGPTRPGPVPPGAAAPGWARPGPAPAGDDHDRSGTTTSAPRT